MPGRFREFNAMLDRSIAAGAGAVGRQHQAMLTSVNDVLRAAGPLIGEAKAQLDRKMPEATSKNVFVVVHGLEHPAEECIEHPLIAHRLEPPGGLAGIDSPWILWAPSHLVAWSPRLGRWINLIFNAGVTADDPFLDGPLDILQQAEDEFLARTDQSGSPFTYTLSVGEPDSASDSPDVRRRSRTAMDHFGEGDRVTMSKAVTRLRSFDS